jgi:hypothetical protein
LVSKPLGWLADFSGGALISTDANLQQPPWGRLPPRFVIGGGPHKADLWCVVAATGRFAPRLPNCQTR